MFLVAQVPVRTLALPQIVVRMVLVLGRGQRCLRQASWGAEGTIALGTVGQHGDTALGRVVLYGGLRLLSAALLPALLSWA